MAWWLLKSEPVKYPWSQLVADRRTVWDGVRNHQAARNLRAMQLGEQAFFYHSNQGLAIVGVVEIVRPWYPEESDPGGRFGMIDVAPLAPLPAPVTLARIKADPALQSMALVRQSRLSVSPVTAEEWARIWLLAGVTL